MKLIFKILVAIILLLSIQNTHAQISKAEIVATGLTCSMCSNAINKQLKKMPEVEKVDTDLNSNTFTVYLQNNNKVTPQILKESIQKAGFFVGSMLVTIDFDNQKIEDNYSLSKGDMNLIIIDPKSKSLNGKIKFKVLDKGYLIMKDFNKFKKTYSKYQTLAKDNENDFHLKSI